jgi:hypothetical protein
LDNTHTVARNSFWYGLELFFNLGAALPEQRAARRGARPCICQAYGSSLAGARHVAALRSRAVGLGDSRFARGRRRANAGTAERVDPATPIHRAGVPHDFPVTTARSDYQLTGILTLGLTSVTV